MSSRSLLTGALLLMPILYGTGCASGTQMNWGLGRSKSTAEPADDKAEVAENAPAPAAKSKRNPFLPFSKKKVDDAAKSSAADAVAQATTPPPGNSKSEIDPGLMHADVELNAGESNDVDTSGRSKVQNADGVNDTENAAQDNIQPVGGTASPGHGKVSHNVDLLKRINTELSDLPAKERAELFHNLKSLEPAMVDQILKIRRMSRNISQNPRAAEAAASLDGGGHTLTSPDGNSNARRSVPLLTSTGDPAKRSGLGQSDPWSTEPAPQKTETLILGESKPIGPPPPQLSQLPTITPSDVAPQETETGLPLSPAPAGENSASNAAGTADGDQSVTNVGLTGNATPTPAANTSQVVVFPPAQADPASGSLTVSTPESKPAIERKTEASLESLIAQAEQELSKLPLGTTPEEQQRFLEKHVFLRMLYWMNKQQERALQPVPGIDPADQEFWQQLFWGMTNYFDSQTIPDEADRAAQTLDQMRSAVQRLQEKAKLEIHNVAFCHKITSFGNYERFNRDEFTPGQPVLIYGEIVNFKSEATADGQYRTILKSTLEIYRAGPQGELVERIPFPATEDLCRQPRTDYFHSYEFTIPKRITLGPHVLKLVVEDQLSKKLATYTINFMVK
ncbi:MAG: hypothetical protein ACKVT0_17425 [Planctomycetaceae bacterium]